MLNCVTLPSYTANEPTTITASEWSQSSATLFGRGTKIATSTFQIQRRVNFFQVPAVTLDVRMLGYKNSSGNYRMENIEDNAEHPTCGLAQISNPASPGSGGPVFIPSKSQKDEKFANPFCLSLCLSFPVAEP